MTFRGHTDVKQLALYVQDQITKGNWSFNVGLRGDFYNGLTTHKEARASPSRLRKKGRRDLDSLLSP